MTTIKNVTEEKEKKKLKSLIGFHSANKIDNYNRRGGEKKKFEKNKWKHKNTNFFLESLLSKSFPSLGISPPHLPRMPSNTVLMSEPAVGAAEVLI